MKRIDATDPRTIRYRFRAARFRRVDAMLREIVAAKGTARVLDIGGRADYWKLLAEDLRPKVSLTLLNFESELNLYRHPPEGLRIEESAGDGCHMPQFADGSFDLAHSNSVIEHVGSYSNMIRLADETRRVGRAYYVQTPNFWFPLEPHYAVPFVHWLPDALRLQLHSRTRVGTAPRARTYRDAIGRIDHTRIVDRRLMRELFPDAEVHAERFLLMVKSLILLRRWADAPALGTGPDTARETAATGTAPTAETTAETTPA